MSQSKCQLGAYKIPQYTLVSLSLKRIVWHFNHRLYWLFSLFPSRTFTTNWPKRQCGFCFYSNTQCILWKMPFQMPQEAHEARARSPAVGQCDGAAEPNLRRSVSGKWYVCVCGLWKIEHSKPTELYWLFVDSVAMTTTANTQILSA